MNGRKDRKTRKSWSEEIMVGFSSAFLFPERKLEAITQGVNIEIYYPDVEENPGSWYRQRLRGKARPWMHSRYIHEKEE